MAARFEVCKCNKHGHIVRRDGYRGPEACFKELALHLVRTGVKMGMFNDEDAAVVVDEILASGLPQTAAEVDPLLLWNSEVLNQISVEHEAEVQRWGMNIIHAVLHVYVDKSEIPADIVSVAERLVRSSLL